MQYLFLLVTSAAFFCCQAFAYRQCGAFELFERAKRHAKNSSTPFGATPLFKVASDPNLVSRTYSSPHFLIHYTLTGPHKVKTLPQDEDLLGLYRSLLKAQPASLSEADKIRNVYSEMDEKGAGHPVYIDKQVKYFEMAHAYYIDSLKMRAPATRGRSITFGRPAVSKKYHIEIVNIATADAYWMGQEIYALTYPPGPSSGIMMENDFMYSKQFRDTESLDSLKSVYEAVTPPIVNNYAVKWEEGIKVTAMHEYYHAVQYTYTPNPDSFHYWYEMSAVAMEERLAPDVNDYLQYLPSFFGNHASHSLNNGCYKCISTYGSGIWHTYLTTKLGMDFDREVWSRLAEKNKPQPALEAVIEAAEHTMQKLYAKFTQPLIYNQSELSNPFQPFSPDMPIWPVLNKKQWGLAPDASDSIILPPLTYEVFSIEASPPQFLKKVSVTGGENLAVTTIFDGAVNEIFFNKDTNQFILLKPAEDAPHNFLIFSNGDWEKSVDIRMSTLAMVQDSGIYAFPNPCRMTNSVPRVLFTKPFQPNSVSIINIYSEYGTLVAALRFMSEKFDWSWDLKDQLGNKVIPGVYYYGSPGKPLRVLLLTAGA